MIRILLRVVQLGFTLVVLVCIRLVSAEGYTGLLLTTLILGVALFISGVRRATSPVTRHTSFARHWPVGWRRPLPPAGHPLAAASDARPPPWLLATRLSCVIHDHR